MQPGDDNSIGVVLDRLKNDLQGAADTLVPWFYQNMPEYYFLTHTEEEQLRHLHAILSAEVMTTQQAVVLKSPCGTRITHIMPGSDMASLVHSVSLLAGDRIQTGRLYTSKDKALRLDTFLLGKQPLCETKANPFQKALDLVKNTHLEPESVQEFGTFLATASEDYVDKFEPNRAVRHFNMCRCVEGTERVHVNLDSDDELGFDRIMVAMANPPAKGVLLQALKVFEREGFEVARAYGDEFERDGSGRIAVLSFYLDREHGGLTEDSDRWRRLERQLRAIKWFAFHSLETLAGENNWEIGRVMLMQAACEFSHQFLIRKNIYAYTSSKIVRTTLKHRDLAELMAAYFEARFDPTIKERREELVSERQEAIHAALRDVNDDISRKILGYMFRFFRHVLRTNYYMPNRFGLSFRMDPRVLPPLPDEERPYAFYCFHGPSSFGFHVRYRDMARGGVRVVRTWTQEQFEIESNRLFDEANQLARAQQYKNKDIPEGGSKAVILLGPTGEIDLAVKSMVDSLLDIIVTDEEGRLSPHIVDYLNHEEIIYLGPDENITPAHIEWITERAAKRGFRWPNAFMSSKPRTGINHKRYGVTSEGVIVFTEEVLRSMNIDPRKDPFTVKLTGGPAGDVASNVVRILHREFGDKARVVAMSDGHGAIYDPDGLDYDELFRLIDSEKRTSHFDPSKLTGRGAFVVSTETPEGIRLRDDLHNVAVADIFIPAGGRPDTMNMKNWQRFMLKDGTPSARSVVEGANLFISPDARAKLEKNGVLCVPGPSANKTGVICSSYEILAGLILTDDEFMAIKDEYVVQLLDILRLRARDEARLLLREYKYAAGLKTLTDISFEVSRAINSLGDTIVETLSKDVSDLRKDQALCELLLAYCPAVLVERHADRIVNNIPTRHQFALLAAFIASRILYAEGLGWINKLTRVRPVRDVVYAYLEEEKRVAAMAMQLRGSNLSDKDELAGLIESSGRQHLTARRLGLA